MFATGVGSLPGTDPWEAARIVAGELADFVHLIEVPGRGPGADIVGRTAGLIAHVVGEFGLDTTPQGWRIAHSGDRIMRRAWSWLAEDLDALEATTQGYAGSIKVQVCGPWTLAASVEARTGQRLIGDRGAWREVRDALATAAAWLVDETHRRVPHASQVFVQFDEPLLRAVAQGTLDTPSGLSRYAPVAESELAQSLEVVFGAVRERMAHAGVHACAPQTPWQVVQRAGADFLSVDLREAPPSDEVLGAYWDRGAPILAGCVLPNTFCALDGGRVSAPVREAASRLGFSDQYTNISVTPTCGLAGSTPEGVRNAYAACQAAQRVLRDERVDHE